MKDALFWESAMEAWNTHVMRNPIDCCICKLEAKGSWEIQDASWGQDTFQYKIDPGDDFLVKMIELHKSLSNYLEEVDEKARHQGRVDGNMTSLVMLPRHARLKTYF